jgi:hypothetical protein
MLAKPLEIDHVPRRPSYTGEPPEARRALLNMRNNHGNFVLNFGLFMHDRSLFAICSVKNGGFAKKNRGFAQTLAGDPPIYAKLLGIDHVPRRDPTQESLLKLDSPPKYEDSQNEIKQRIEDSQKKNRGFAKRHAWIRKKESRIRKRNLK